MISRRKFFKLAGAGALMVGADFTLTWSLAQSPDDPYSSGGRALSQPWYDSGFIGDPLMDERLLFYLGHSWYQMAEISECLDTASRIKAGDIAGWQREWYHTADRLRQVAETSQAGGHSVSAGEAYLRTTSYYLAGLIYSESPDEPGLQQHARLSADCFTRALTLLDIPGEPVNIPYADSALPAYFFRSPLADESAPLLIAHQGMDASIEETYFLAQGALARGYHCLLFHHPGQGLALRLNGLTFRPDWEQVITPVVDFALGLPGIDPDRIALMGLSFGGALVLRAVAFEKRIAVCISDPPVYDWGGIINNFLFAEYPEMADLLASDPEAFNQAMMQFLANAPSMYRWWFNAAMWKYGQSTPAELINHLQAYSLADVLDQITCKVLLMDGEAEAWGKGDAHKIYDLLSCPKDYILFTAEDTALLHNQTAALAVANQRLFDWLDDNL